MNYRLNRDDLPGSLEGLAFLVLRGIAWLRLVPRRGRAMWGTLPAATRLRLPKERRLLVLTCALALVGIGLLAELSPVMAQGADSGSDVAQRRDQVLASGDYQTDRPTPRELEELSDPIELPEGLVEAILWTIAGIVGVMIALFLYNAFQSRAALRINRDHPQPTPRLVETPPSDPQRALAARTLEEADALAAEGRFTEAIHLLLLVAMDRLKRELGNRLTPALTGREVLRLAPIPQAVVNPLSRMVSLSEIKHFGGRDAAAPDYAQCRADFLAFSGLEGAS